jgi:hypothetical protein
LLSLLDTACHGPRAAALSTRDAEIPRGAAGVLRTHLGKQKDDHEAALALAWARWLIGQRRVATLTELSEADHDDFH